MFKGIGSKLNDMGTIKFLCERAETYALQDQQREPGAEHFLLASLDLPDGTWAGGIARRSGSEERGDQDGESVSRRDDDRRDDCRAQEFCLL
ncbi:hypothetical protein ACE10X_34930 [Bradyrhizobium sp. Pha-3]|uniref:hypothetical protein n=1 Tax=Bradyrhizobium sp. Pha-3 TaxID=208375 RepID=UPI0035D4809F